MAMSQQALGCIIILMSCLLLDQCSAEKRIRHKRQNGFVSTTGLPVLISSRTTAPTQRSTGKEPLTLPASTLRVMQSLPPRDKTTTLLNVASLAAGADTTSTTTTASSTTTTSSQSGGGGGPAGPEEDTTSSTTTLSGGSGRQDNLGSSASAFGPIRLILIPLSVLCLFQKYM